jgi:hypothetical protein
MEKSQQIHLEATEWSKKINLVYDQLLEKSKVIYKT